VNWLARRDRRASSDLRWLLRESGAREPRKVAEPYLRPIRDSELVCCRTGHDFERGSQKSKAPVAAHLRRRRPARFGRVDAQRAQKPRAVTGAHPRT
jgi:hypothetical protein